MTMRFLSVLFLLVFSAAATNGAEKGQLLEQGRAAMENNDFEKAYQLFAEAHRIAETDPEPAYWLARAEISRSNPQNAVSLMETVIRKSADHAEYQYWYGTAIAADINRLSALKKMGAARRMRQAWEKAVELDPAFLPARIGLLRYYLQAPGIAGGSRKKAQAMADEINKLDKTAGCRALVTLHMHDKDYEKAGIVLRQAISSMPENMELRLDLGAFYQQRENWPRAMEQYQIILGQDPENMNALYQFGRTALFSGLNLKQGKESMEKYIGLIPEKNQPSLAWAHTRLGQLLVRMGQPDQAHFHLEQALQLEPKIEEARKALREIQALGEDS